MKQQQFERGGRPRWREFEQLVSRASFWDLPQVDDRIGYDGFWWTLEASDAGRQHRVTRWSPEPGAYWALCEYMLEASGIHAPPVLQGASNP